MNRFIRLTPKQKKTVHVEPPFPLPHKVTKEELHDLVVNLLAGSAPARERLILGHVYLVLNITGRFIRYWPKTNRFKDDMVSEGIIALIEKIDSIESRDEYEWLPANIITQVRDRIQYYVNGQHMVGASARTNRRRHESGTTLEIENTIRFKEHMVSREDDGPLFVDIADALETLHSYDDEEIIDAVLRIEEYGESQQVDPSHLEDIRGLVHYIKGQL